MRRLLLMGPPGSGKGTQAAVVARQLSIPAISTGDIFRENVAAGTALGREAKEYMARGHYVPDSVTNQMVSARLAEADAIGGFILDGYPRTVPQVEFLDEVLAAQDVELDRVLLLTVDVEEVVGRLKRRAGAEGRHDDDEQIIRHRLKLFAEQTAPLAAEYERRGLLVRIDGMGTIEEVSERMLAAASDDGAVAAEPASDAAGASLRAQAQVDGAAEWA
ncbi:MAG TPA: adenylate kinase [Jiangellaceae bacterium]|nr:adenylate kinase [Jiangellaceae bacterium]